MTEHFATTPVIAALHPRCGAPVLTGLAEGVHTRVDLIPLNQAGEIHALLAGLDTYTLTRGGLVHRDPIRIRSADLAAAGPVLAEHACGRQVPADHRAVTAAPAARPAATDTPAY